MQEVKIITMTPAELEVLMTKVCREAISEAFAKKDDEMLNVSQLCDRIPGLSRYVFKKLANKAKLKNVRGKYSLNAVKVAMQSH